METMENMSVTDRQNNAKSGLKPYNRDLSLGLRTKQSVLHTAHKSQFNS